MEHCYRFIFGLWAICLLPFALVDKPARNHNINFMMSLVFAITFIIPGYLAPPDSFIYPLRTDTMTELEFTIVPPRNFSGALFFKIDWGDGETLDWIGPFRAPVEPTRYHKYRAPGNYIIRVISKDSSENLSDWSSPCSVKVIPSLVKWFFPTIEAIVAAPTLDEHGNIYIGDDSGTFYSLNPNGELRWTFSCRQPIYASAAVHRGLIYLPSLDSHLYCLDTLGKLHWSVNLADELWTPPAINADGTLFLTTDAGRLVSLTPQGKIRWSVKLGNEISSAPTIGPDGMVYVSADSFYSFTPKGKRRWALAVPEDAYFFAAAVPDRDGNLVVGNFDGHIYTIRPDGKIRWRLPVPDEDEIRTEVIYGPEGTTFWGTDGYYLCARKDTGALRIIYEANDVICATPAVSANGTVYILPDDGTFYAFDRQGRLFLKQDIAYGDKDIYYTSSPVIGPDGTVYVGSWDGGLYAFYGDAPPAETIWSQFRQNAQRTGRAITKKQRR